MPKKTVKNISGFTQLDIEPGETGEVELTQDEEDRMVNRGAIEVVSDTPESTDAPETSEPEKTQEEIEAEQKAADEAAAAAKAEAERGGRRGRS